MQAINNTSPVATVKARRAGRYSPTISSSNGTTRASTSRPRPARRVPPAGSPNIAPALLCSRVRASTAACSAETPGASRPSALKATMTTIRVCCPDPPNVGGVNGGTTSGVQNSPAGLGK